MIVFSTIVILLLACPVYAQLDEEIDAASAQVSKFLLLSERQTSGDETAWLKNCGKIGAGYDNVKGSPVCYSGKCQMEGFRQPVFKLNINKQSEGSCTDKLIPEHVSIDCLPSLERKASTESISSLEELMQSTKQGIEFEASVGAYGNSFSYGFSRETRSMINTIIQHNSTVYFTRSMITWVRLQSFVPFLTLSPGFKYVIDKMPCCNESRKLDQYIREFIINYFGLMYVKDLLLGGIAQQKVTVSEENRKKLEENGVSTSNKAAMKAEALGVFSASAKMAFTDQRDESKSDAFRKYTEHTSFTTLGGSTNLQSIEEWSKTIPSNPSIVEFRVSPILSLLTTHFFPGDPQIEAKADLIRAAQEKYVNSPLSCINNCSGHGDCVPSGYFQFGKCKCFPEWDGMDCSQNASARQGRLVRLFRYRSKDGMHHFYTTSSSEIGTVHSGQVGNHGYISEGTVGRIFDVNGPQPQDTLPLYRYVHTSQIHYYYTTDWEEIDTNIPGSVLNGWKCEGIQGYIYIIEKPGTVPLHRYSRESKIVSKFTFFGFSLTESQLAHDHFYTPNADEIGTTVVGATGKDGYRYAGITGYVVP